MGLVVVGAGGHGSDTLELAGRCEVQVAGFVDDGDVLFRMEGRATYLGPLSAIPDLPWTLGIGYPAGRSAVARKLTGSPAAALVDPSAVVASSALLGVGAAVFWQTGVSPRVEIGDHAFVSYGATVGHDSVIGPYTTVMPGASVSGDVVIGAGVLVGAGSVVLQGITIGDGARIGAGAVVVRDVGPGVTVRGIPAS